MAILHNGKRITSLRVVPDENGGNSGGGSASLQSKTVKPSFDAQVVKPDDGYDGLSYVLVDAVKTTEQATPILEVSESGLITAAVDQAEGWVSEGRKEATLQLETQGETVILPGSESQVAIGSGVFTTGTITVEPVLSAERARPEIMVDPSGLIIASSSQEEGYVKKGVESTTRQLATQGAKTITPSKSSQTAVEEGIFTTGAVTVAAIPEAARGVPSIAIDAAGVITSSVEQEEGYVDEGVETASLQLPTQGAKTITPSKNSQTAIEAGVFATGAVTVGAIPSDYVVPSGTRNVTVNGEYDVKSYAKVKVNVAAEEPVCGTVSTPGAGNETISFSGLPGNPSWFTVTMSSTHTTGYVVYIVVNLVYQNGKLTSLEEKDGKLYSVNTADNWYDISYSNATLSITGLDSYFLYGVTYTLYYSV